jgi:hypothetical protein
MAPVNSVYFKKDDCIENQPNSFLQSKRALAAPHGPGPICAVICREQKPAVKPFDVKEHIHNIVASCHEDYGRKANKVRLMNSERSDDYLFNRIKNGLPGRMALSAPPSVTTTSTRS